MTTITRECDAKGCTNTVSYGIETHIPPRFCSFTCRDRTERVGVYAPPRGEEHQHGGMY